MAGRDRADDGIETPDEEWEFTIEDIERREAEKREAERVERERSEPIEPGEPTLEGVLFVLLGAALAIFVLSRFFVG